jgi:hypothetical protein
MPPVNRRSGTHTISAEVSGFTPVFDVVARELGNTAANVYGAAWRFCQMSDGVCRASLRTIADRLNLNEATVHKYLKLLVQANYLEDITPHVRRTPHIYRDTHKARLKQGRKGHDSELAVCETNRVFDSQSGTTDSVYQTGLTRQSIRDQQDTKRGASNGAIVPKADDVFELRLFREVAGFYPPKLIFDEVINAVRKIGERLGRPPVADDLRPYIKAWVTNGWKPTNLVWLFEWATRGAVPTRIPINGNEASRDIRPRHEDQPITAEQRAAIQRINAARRAVTGVPEMQ